MQRKDDLFEMTDRIAISLDLSDLLLSGHNEARSGGQVERLHAQFESSQVASGTKTSETGQKSEKFV